MLRRDKGKRQSTDEMVLLLMDEDGQNVTLEVVDASIALNLTSAPWEGDEHKLAEQYAMLSAEDTAGPSDDSQHSSLDDAGPDPNNPFDYRHYLDSNSSAAPVSKSTTNGAVTPLHKAVKSTFLVPGGYW